MSLGLIVSFILGYISSNSKTTISNMSTTETMIQESPLQSLEVLSALESSPSPKPSQVPEPSIDVTMLEQIFHNVVGEEIDLRNH